MLTTDVQVMSAQYTFIRLGSLETYKQQMLQPIAAKQQSNGHNLLRLHRPCFVKTKKARGMMDRVRVPLGGCAPRRVKASGCRWGHCTASFSPCFTPSRPPTSLHRTFGTCIHNQRYRLLACRQIQIILCCGKGCPIQTRHMQACQQSGNCTETW